MERSTVWWAAAGGVLSALAAAIVFFQVQGPAIDAKVTAVTPGPNVSPTIPGSPVVASPAATTVPPPSPAMPASSPAGKTGLSPGRAWDQAFVQARQTNIRVAAHQAAISGSLIDAMAVERARQRCLILNVQYLTALNLHKEKVTDAMRQAGARLEQVCEGAATVSPPKLLAIRDDAGFGELAEPLLTRSGFARDATLRDRVLQRILETQSLELLDAFASRLLKTATMPQLGLQPSPDLPAVTDEAMLWLAVQLRACNARGDCDRTAQENFQCIEYQNCLADLNQFPEQLIFVPPAQRFALYRLTEKPVDEAVLRRRWAEIQAAVARIGG